MRLHLSRGVQRATQISRLALKDGKAERKRRKPRGNRWNIDQEPFLFSAGVSTVHGNSRVNWRMINKQAMHAYAQEGACVPLVRENVGLRWWSMIEVPWQVPLPWATLRKTVRVMVRGFVTIATSVVLLWLNHWWIGDGVVGVCSCDRRLFYCKVLVGCSTFATKPSMCVWSAMQNRRNCRAITATCTDT